MGHPIPESRLSNKLVSGSGTQDFVCVCYVSLLNWNIFYIQKVFTLYLVEKTQLHPTMELNRESLGLTLFSDLGACYKQILIVKTSLREFGALVAQLMIQLFYDS